MTRDATTMTRAVRVLTPGTRANLRGLHKATAVLPGCTCGNSGCAVIALLDALDAAEAKVPACICPRPYETPEIDCPLHGLSTTELWARIEADAKTVAEAQAALDEIARAEAFYAPSPEKRAAMDESRRLQDIPMTAPFIKSSVLNPARWFVHAPAGEDTEMIFGGAPLQTCKRWSRRTPTPCNHSDSTRATR